MFARCTSLMIGVSAAWCLTAAYAQGAIASVARSGPGSAEARIVSYSIAPDGRQLEETVVIGRGSERRMQILVKPVADPHGNARVLYAADGVSAVKWLSNQNIAFVEYGVVSQIIEMNIVTGRHVTVLRSSHEITLREWDAEHRMLAYSYQVPWKWGRRVSVRMNDGVSTMHYIEPVWARQAETHIGVIALGRHLGDESAHVMLKMAHFLISPTLRWSRGALLALVQSTSSYRTRIYNLMTGQRVDCALPLFNLETMAVSDDGRLALASTRIWKSRPRAIAGWNGSKNLYVAGKDARLREVSVLSNGDYLVAVSGLWWVNDDDVLAEVMGSKGVGGADRWWLKEVNWKTNRVIGVFRWPRGDLGGIGSNCEFDRERTVGLCVAQSMTTPPELVEVNVRTGQMVAIGQMNPKQRTLPIEFLRMRIRNRFGNVSTAFLALPRGTMSHPVPLAVMAYGFTEAYSRDAQWITSYPVAQLVRAGIAVCLVNWAHIRGLRAGAFSDELRIMRGGISTLENALPAVRALGVRVSRAMVMGWSFGGLFAAHVIEVDRDYVAAQVGDPADWTIAGYALGNRYWRNVARWGMGGPPVRRFIRGYLAMDPVGSGRRPKGPVLLEFVSRNPAVGQLYQEWRAVGAEVEAFVYHRSVHWLNVPAEARVSRLRNLYWAKLNLLGPQSVTLAQLRSVGLTIPSKGWWDAGQAEPGGGRHEVHCFSQPKRGAMSQLRRTQGVQRVAAH